MMERITFEKLPEAVNNLTREFQELRDAILKRSEQRAVPATKPFLNVKETAEFLNLAVPTIYSKVSRGELPFKKRGKKLYFSVQELGEYVTNGGSKTEVCDLLKKKGGKK